MAENCVTTPLNTTSKDVMRMLGWGSCCSLVLKYAKVMQESESDRRGKAAEHIHRETAVSSKSLLVLECCKQWVKGDKLMMAKTQEVLKSV